MQRLHQDRIRLQRFDTRHHAPDYYRYSRGGRYYNVSRQGGSLLQQALNHGYAQGLRAGQADRLDGWQFNHRDCFAFQDATYGYTGYVDVPEYRHYFREGFSRGYEDGYYGRSTYGSSGGLLGSVLLQILNLQRF